MSNIYTDLAERWVVYNEIKKEILIIRAEIERLHYNPKLDFVKNDEVVDMALAIIDKHIKGVSE